MLDASIVAEVAALAERYGTPRRAAVELEGGSFAPLNSRDRFGEVCMVVRRANGRLLTASKTFYPPGAFRLLTGGIKHGESIEAALLRETWEETGLDVAVRRFLAVIEYRLGAPRENRANKDGQPSFVTFAFLLDELGGTLAVQDPDEQLGAFHELAVDDLPAAAHTLAHIGGGVDPEIHGSWSDWGRFRAVVHREVYQALREG